MIIAHLTNDTRSLRACTLTCYSWYIAAVPHLHYCLLIGNPCNKNFCWPNPLQQKHILGLLPFVKIFWIRGVDPLFSPKSFHGDILHHFSALNHVQQLFIDNLDIPSFVPQIQRYFEHFLPTVQELCLRYPSGSPREIVFFVGSFEHLEDLCIICDRFSSQGEPVDDLTLIPPFTPPLRGSLRLISFRRVGLLRDMIDLFGGLRFRSMELWDVDGMPLLLNACAKTLETLRLWPTDPHGKWLFPKGVRISTDNSQVSSSLLDFDLSQNKLLQTLQIQVSPVGHGSPDVVSSFLNHTLSTVTSPGFFQVTAAYYWSDFLGVEPWRRPDQHLLREISEAERGREISRHRRLFEAFRGVHKIRDFRLQLCAAVWDPVGEYSMGILKEAVAEEKAKGGFDGFLSEPLVTCHPRRACW